MKCVVMVPEGMLRSLFEYFTAHTHLSWCGDGHLLFGNLGRMYECRWMYCFCKENGLYGIEIYGDNCIRYEESNSINNIIGFNEMFNKETYEKIGVEWHE